MIAATLPRWSSATALYRPAPAPRCRSRNPTSAGTRLNTASVDSSSSAARHRSTNSPSSRKSFGGYPLRANSGKRTSCAPFSAASFVRSRMRDAFASKAPTVVSICASAILTRRAVTLPRLGVNRRAKTRMLPKGHAPSGPIWYIPPDARRSGAAEVAAPRPGAAARGGAGRVGSAALMRSFRAPRCPRALARPDRAVGGALRQEPAGAADDRRHDGRDGARGPDQPRPRGAGGGGRCRLRRGVHAHPARAARPPRHFRGEARTPAAAGVEPGRAAARAARDRSGAARHGDAGGGRDRHPLQRGAGAGAGRRRPRFSRLPRRHRRAGREGRRRPRDRGGNALRAAFLLCGARDIAALRASRRVILDPLRTWIESLAG